MKTEDQYLKFVSWEEEDQLYVGYCPDLFPAGGVCHGATGEEAYAQLCELVREEVADVTKVGGKLPKPSTRPMKDAVPA